MSTTIRSPSADYKSLQGKKKKASFECQSCTRKFATRSHLVRHSRVHTGERRYACDYPGCEMRCSRKDNLQQHYRTHLVVNPRRANASQSMLTAAQEYEPNATETSPERAENNAFTAQDVKPIQSRTAIPETDASVNVNIMPSGAVVSTVNGLPAAHEREDPDREWSVSPPPPLSSAYDYWYAHGCLPHTVRNPASVSGSGSSGATSPEMSNALELAPGQRTFVDSPTTYYHPSSHISSAATYPSYTETEGQTGPSAVRPSFPLGNNPFPPVADYHHHTHHHQRSHSHSYSMGSYSRIGYESATASPQLPSAQSHAHTTAAAANGGQIQGQARHYSTDSFDQAPFHRTLGTFNSAGASPSGPPEGSFHAPHSTSHSHPNYTRHHSLNEGPFHPMPETGVDSRPVTRHGSMGTSTPHYSMPVFPSHPHTQMPFGVPVDMSHGHGHPHGGHAPFGESPVSRHSIPMGVPGSPRGRPSPTHSHSHSASSLVLPPIRYAGGHEMPAGPVGGVGGGLSLGSYGGMNVGGHAPFGSGNSWDRMNISDARALPAAAAAPGHSSLGNEMPR